MRADVSSALSTEGLDGLADAITSARRASRLINEALKEEGLREDHWRILHALGSSHGLMMSEIAQGLALPPATTTRLVDDLLDRSLVFRQSSPTDGRQAIAYLSRLGEECLRRSEAVIRARLGAWLSPGPNSAPGI